MSELVELVGPPSAARGQRRRPAPLRNPVRLSQIGADRLQVFIRAPDGCAELLALVERLEQLLDVGYDAIDVVFEHERRSSPSPPPSASGGSDQ